MIQEWGFLFWQAEGTSLAAEGGMRFSSKSEVLDACKMGGLSIPLTGT